MRGYMRQMFLVVIRGLDNLSVATFLEFPRQVGLANNVKAQARSFKLGIRPT